MYVVLFNFPCALGSQLHYLWFANGIDGVEYCFHHVFQPILATPQLETFCFKALPIFCSHIIFSFGISN